MGFDKRTLAEEDSWTEIDDDLLKQLVVQMGTEHWNGIAEFFNIGRKANVRSAKDCKSRWFDVLDPALQR